jgi:hypothetical protein
MSLVKNLGFKFFLKILLQICDNPERSQKFSEKWHFLAKKFFKNAILGGGRVAFNENFIGGEGIL